MKRNIFVIILSFLTTLQVFGQKNEDFPSFEKFYDSIIENMKYPIPLQDSCLATVTLMKIQFDNNGKLQPIGFSDSAHPDFAKHIQKIADRLNFKSIYLDLKQKGHANNIVLIPIQIDFEKMDQCKSTISSADIKKLYVFNGNTLSGKYFLYPNLYFRLVIGKAHEEHF